MKQLIQIKDGKAEWGEQFDWGNILFPLTIDQTKEWRFTLYDTGTLLTECLFFDIDDVPSERREEVYRTVVGVVGNYLHYAVDTGGGVHIYYPLKPDDYISKEMFAGYRDSYRSLVERIDEALLFSELAGKADPAVFSSRKLGRIPGCPNIKRKSKVRLIDWCSGPYMPIKSLLTYKEGVYSETLDVHAFALPDKVKAHCPAVKDFIKNPEAYKSYGLWFALASVFTGIGCADEFTKLSKTASSWDDKSAQSIADAAKSKYNFSCKKISGLYAKERPEFKGCENCSHNVSGSNPIFISGALPTPSRKAGFVRRKKLSNKGVFVDCPPFIVPDDIINNFINLHADDFVRTRESADYYMFKDTHWVYVGDKTLTTGEPAFRYEYHTMPVNYRTTYKENIGLDTCLRTHALTPTLDDRDFDAHRGVYFKNSVIDLSNNSLKITKPGPQYRNRTFIDHNFDPKAKCPKFREWIRWASDGSEYLEKMVQMLFGLTIAAIPPAEYQAFFWLTGNTGTGKSTLAALLSALVGVRQTAVYSSSGQSNTHERPDLRGKLLLVMNDLKPHTWFKGEQNRFYTYVQELAGDSVISQKVAYKPQMTIVPTCAIVCTSNYHLTGLDSVPGVKRRYVPLEFWKVPKERSFSFVDELLSERAGLYTYAIEGLEMYLGGEFVKALADPARELLIADGVDDDEDPLLVFVRETYVQGEFSDRIKIHDVFQDYLDYRELPPQDVPYRVRTLKNVKRALAHIFKLPPSMLSYKSNGIRYYKGIKRREKACTLRI